MLTRSMREAAKRREGQALVVACLMILILSIAVLATINVGHTITERVRLQNTADAASYSMAAMEARAFNFYAFSNRTHVSHYVAAMVWQSMLSFLYFLEAFFADALGVVLTANPCGQPQGKWALVCPVIEALPYVGQFLQAFFQALNAIKTVLQGIAQGIQTTLKSVNPDYWIGKLVIPGHRLLNEALTGIAQATLAGTMTHVLSTSNDVVEANDPNVDSKITRLMSGALSVCILDRAHMEASGVSLFKPGNPFTPLDPTAINDDDPVARAKRSMGKISNATRFACDHDNGFGSACGPGWVTDRRPGNLIPLPQSLGVLRDIINGLDWKWGQTKMLSHNFAVQPGADRNYIRDWKSDLKNKPWSDLAQGDNIGSDDIYQIKIGPAGIGVPGFSAKNPLSCDNGDDPKKCWGDPRVDKNDKNKMPFAKTVKTSIWALNDQEFPSTPGGLHWRLVTDQGVSGSKPSDAPNFNAGAVFNNYRNLGLNVFKKDILKVGFVTVLDTEVYVANVRPIFDGNHPWGGIVKFPHFEPGKFAKPCGEGLGSSGTPSMLQAALRDEEFNQPSTWVVLNKKPEELLNPNTDTTGAGNNKPALLNDSKALTFAFKQPTKLTLDNSRKQFLLFKGLSVISRGQTYYHRPGNWAEQPNFFNPYWKPRLASVWQGRKSLPLVDDVTNWLPGPLKSLPPKILTH